MDEIADVFVDTPAISPFYKPLLGVWGQGTETQHVARWPDRVVVTWITTDPFYYVHGVPPEKPARFQAVLRADGSIRFNYSDITFGDGIVGLFPDDEVVKGDLIASVVDGADPELPGYLDVVEAAIYASNTDAVILEFTTRDPIPRPDEGTLYSYNLFFDTDRPWWTFADFSDEDFVWWIDRTADGTDTGGRGVRGAWASDASNRIALLVDIRDLQGISASALITTIQFDNDSSVPNDFSSPTQIALPIVPPKVDLSQSGSGSSWRHHEVFHYQSRPDLSEIACRVIDVLGDRFDLFVFHSEFRVDHQEPSTPWHAYNPNTVKGLGQIPGGPTPCGEGRLKGNWDLPVWMYSIEVFDASLERNEPMASVEVWGYLPMSSRIPGQPMPHMIGTENASRCSATTADVTGATISMRSPLFLGTRRGPVWRRSWAGEIGATTGTGRSHHMVATGVAASPGLTFTSWAWPTPAKCRTCSSCGI